MMRNLRRLEALELRAGVNPFSGTSDDALQAALNATLVKLGDDGPPGRVVAGGYGLLVRTRIGDGALMARQFTKRLDELERQSDTGSSVLLILEPGESIERAASGHEAKHGPRLLGQQWLPILTGVPRGDYAWCA